ncbi:hypothetical protein LguiB_013810 [Lonicera macranthoides]
MPTKRSRLASNDQSCAGMSKRVSTAHITCPEIARQELSHSLNDLEENAGMCVLLRVLLLLHKVEMSRKNMPTDKVGIWRETRKKVDGNYCIEDGAAGKEETLTRSLEALLPKEKNNPEVRDIIFVEVIGPDGHDCVLCSRAELEQAKVDMKNEVSKTKRELIMMKRSAGLFMPENTPSTSS